MSTLLFLSMVALIAGAITFEKSRKDKRMSVYDASFSLGKYFNIGDFLVSRDFPKIKTCHLTGYEFENLTKLVSLLDPLVVKYGKPRIHSGGRPRRIGDFVSALRARGLRPSDPSAHDAFAATDISWPVPATNESAWHDAIDAGAHQAILYPSFLHIAIDQHRADIPKIIKRSAF